MVEKQVLIHTEKYQPINVCSETVNDKCHIRMPTTINKLTILKKSYHVIDFL